LHLKAIELRLVNRVPAQTIAAKLLSAAGNANPNLVIYATENSTAAQEFDEQFYFKGSTCLVEACRIRDLGMIDLLLKYGARDDDCKALMVAGGESVIVSKLLALKANQDLENGINKKGISEFNRVFASKGFAKVGSLAYNSSIFPTTSVMINWHNQVSYYCLITNITIGTV
jgi:hypothetical protein